jgi:hypothetical protein
MADGSQGGRKPGTQALRERRRTAARRAGPLRAFSLLFRLVSMMGRPLVLSRRNGRLQLGFAERRRAVVESPALAPPPEASLALAAVLRKRAMEFAPHDAMQSMHHVLVVHDTLSSRGWAGVEALPAPVLGRALQQTRMLHRHRPAPALAEVIARLRPLLLAAEGRAPGEARRLDVATGGQLEVSEASHSDFDASARSWFGELPEPGVSCAAGAAASNRPEPKRES